MTIKCQCGAPLRYLGSIGINIAGGLGSVVGVECPDPKCRKHRVIPAKDWVESLEWGPEEKAAGYK